MLNSKQWHKVNLHKFLFILAYTFFAGETGYERLFHAMK